MLKGVMINLICNNCGGPIILGQSLFEEHQIKIQKDLLKDELNHIYALIYRFLGKLTSSLANPMALSASNPGM